MECKGWIALDIDGTITLDVYSVPDEVIAYLRSLQSEGWQIAMATGRPFRFAQMALSGFDFPYLFLPQNGSAALQMPEKTVLFKRFLPWDAMALIEQAFEGTGTSFIVYMGFERGDLCYFRPDQFSKNDFSALHAWQDRQKEEWTAVDRFTSDLIPEFSLVKCFGPFPLMQKIAARLIATERFQVSLLVSPLDPQRAILLITDVHASKGLSLRDAVQRLGRGHLVIAAGDEENDVSLLRAADIKIAMPHAPDALKSMADFIAPPTGQNGIIEALQKAIKQGRQG